MAKISASGKKPGPQQPNKYQSTGPNYAQWGEQPGFYYVPQTDSYYVNQKELEGQLQEQGVLDKPPEAPGLAETLLPIAGTAGAIYAGKEIAPMVVDAVKGTMKPGGLFNAGAAPATTGAQAAANNPGFYGPGGDPSGLLPAGGQGAEIAAPGTAATPPGGLFSVGSTGGNILGGAGIAVSGYTAYQGIKDKNPVTAGLGGVGVAAGLNQLGYALGPYGWAAAVALPVAMAAYSKFADKDEWKTEQKRMNKLAEGGAYIPENLLAGLNEIHKGRSKEELVQIAKETGGNVTFAESRDEKDLKGADIVNYSTFVEQDPEWFKKPLEQRLAYADQLLAQGIVREKKGSIYVDWKKAPPPPWESGAKAAVGAVGTSGAPTQAPATDNQRTQTRSPGIGLDGKRINYGLMAGAR